MEDRVGEVGLELIHNGITYVLVEAKPIRLMTGFKGNVCRMCQLDSACGKATGYTRAMHLCGSGPVIFVKKLEV